MELYYCVSLICLTKFSGYITDGEHWCLAVCYSSSSFCVFQYCSYSRIFNLNTIIPYSTAGKPGRATETI